MLRTVAIPGLPKRLRGGYKPFSPEEAPGGKVPPCDDPEAGEEEDEGNQPEPQEQLRAGLVVGPEPLEAVEHYIALNRFSRMKLSRSISSSRCRMNASVAFSSGITRNSNAFTRRFTFSISSIRRRIVVSISAAVITFSTRSSYASAASSIRGLVPTIP